MGALLRVSDDAILKRDGHLLARSTLEVKGLSMFLMVSISPDEIYHPYHEFPLGPTVIMTLRVTLFPLKSSIS